MKRHKPRKQPEAPADREAAFFRPGKSADLSGTGFFQPKLEIGSPGDRFEQEADRVADAVVGQGRRADGETSALHRMSNEQAAQDERQPGLQRQDEEEELQASLQRQIEEEEEPVQMELQRQEEEEEALQPRLQCQEEEEELQASLQRQAEEEEEPVQMEMQLQVEEEEELQAKPQARGERGRSDPGAHLSSRLVSTQGRGQPLPEGIRRRMERALGRDFAGVRIHTDPEAVRMNQELGSQAFTQGEDIYFNEGKFDPDSESGEHLLAHELTHVVQQSRK
jgi:hypothetical protein